MAHSKELWLPRSGYYAAIDDSGTRYSLLSPDTAAQARALNHEVWGDLSSLRPLNGLAGGDPEVFVAYGRCTPSDEVTLSSCGLEQEADPGNHTFSCASVADDMRRPPDAFGIRGPTLWRRIGDLNP